MIDSSIGINGIFENPSFGSWEDITKKMLGTEDLEKKLLFKSVEGFDLFPLHNENKFIAELNTFPKKVEISETLPNFDIELSLIHNAGGSIVQEIAYGIFQAIKLIESGKTQLNISVAIDSLYFANIAKLRALRFILERLNEESSDEISFKIYGTNSLREQTLFDPWVNMLRNNSSSMAAIIGGADFVHSYSYDSLATHFTKKPESNLGQRQSLNQLKILLEESYLSQVKDYSKGSYLIENLTEELIKSSWELVSDGALENEESFSKAVESVSQKRYELVRKRRSTITGVNNFANPTEDLENLYQTKFDITHLQSSNELFPIRFISFEFENLRSSFRKESNPIAVVIFGDEAKLSARANFCQNYFEVLGADVKIVKGETPSDHHIIICAQDGDYEDNLSGYIETVKATSPKSIYLAGNYDHKSSDIIDNLFMGQNVFEVLEKFVKEVC